MGDHVESHNQSGGITAKVVNAGVNASVNEEQDERTQNNYSESGLGVWQRVAIAATIIAGVIAALEFFGVVPLGLS